MPDYLITGVGGQGTVLASKMIAMAALNCGMNVRTTETIGMAQRGGSVVSHVRVGETIYSPLIPLGKADALIAFEPFEAVRCLPYLSEHGKLIICDSEIKPAAITATPATPAATSAQPTNLESMLIYIKTNYPNAVILPGARLKQHSPRTLNVALLGAAAECGLFPFGADALKEVITSLLPQRFWEINQLSFEAGRSIYNDYTG